MRTKLPALIVAGALGMLSQSANAIPVDVSGVNTAVSTASAVEKTHYWRHRHGFVKCYYELVIGPYVCRHFQHW